jgi:thiol-disulfide isomerase/thioredoxin
MKKISGTFIVLISLINIAQSQRIWDFSLNDVDNHLHSFNELKGEKLTLLDFWTTWCKPCNKSIPELNKIYESYRDQGVQIIGINCDGPRSVAKVAPFSRALDIQYPVLIDINSELMNSLNLANFPTLIMVNASGDIEYIHEGYVTGDEELIKAEIDKRLSK